eukprot:403337232
MKRNIDNREVTFQNKFLFITAFVLLTLGFSFLYWGILIASYSVKSSGSGLLVGALIVGGWPYLKYIRGRLDEFPTLEGIVTEQLGVYVGTLNQQMVQRGLFWNAVPGYFWLELHVDRLVLKQNSHRELLIKFHNKVDMRKTAILQRTSGHAQRQNMNQIYIYDEYSDEESFTLKKGSKGPPGINKIQQYPMNEAQRNLQNALKLRIGEKNAFGIKIVPVPVGSLDTDREEQQKEQKKHSYLGGGLSSRFNLEQRRERFQRDLDEYLMAKSGEIFDLNLEQNKQSLQTLNQSQLNNALDLIQINGQKLVSNGIISKGGGSQHQKHNTAFQNYQQSANQDSQTSKGTGRQTYIQAMNSDTDYNMVNIIEDALRENPKSKFNKGNSSNLKQQQTLQHQQTSSNNQQQTTYINTQYNIQTNTTIMNNNNLSTLDRILDTQDEANDQDELPLDQLNQMLSGGGDDLEQMYLEIGRNIKSSTVENTNQQQLQQQQQWNKDTHNNSNAVVAKSQRNHPQNEYKTGVSDNLTDITSNNLGNNNLNKTPDQFIKQNAMKPPQTRFRSPSPNSTSTNKVQTDIQNLKASGNSGNIEIKPITSFGIGIQQQQNSLNNSKLNSNRSVNRSPPQNIQQQLLDNEQLNQNLKLKEKQQPRKTVPFTNNTNSSYKIEQQISNNNSNRVSPRHSQQLPQVKNEIQLQLQNNQYLMNNGSQDSNHSSGGGVNRGHLDSFDNQGTNRDLEQIKLLQNNSRNSNINNKLLQRDSNADNYNSQSNLIIDKTNNI